MTELKTQVINGIRLVSVESIINLADLINAEQGVPLKVRDVVTAADLEAKLIAPITLEGIQYLELSRAIRFVNRMPLLPRDLNHSLFRSFADKKVNQVAPLPESIKFGPEGTEMYKFEGTNVYGISSLYLARLFEELYKRDNSLRPVAHKNLLASIRFEYLNAIGVNYLSGELHKRNVPSNKDLLNLQELNVWAGKDGGGHDRPTLNEGGKEGGAPGSRPLDAGGNAEMFIALQEDTYLSSQNKEHPHYWMSPDLTFLVSAKYSRAIRHHVLRDLKRYRDLVGELTDVTLGSVSVATYLPNTLERAYEDAGVLEIGEWW